jgi:hypothetical protein
MSRRILTPWGGLVATVAVVCLATVGLRAQASGQAAAKAGDAAKKPAASKRWAPTRTPWGDPDLQGVWDYRTITPLERPQNVGGREFLTDAEATQLEARAAKRLDQPPDETVPATTIHAPYWTDPGRKVLNDKRTSLIIDPPDGRIPPLTQEGQSRAQLRGRGGRGEGGRDGGRADGPEDRSTLERCITQGLPTASLPTLYNNNIQIFQAPGYVAILHEMVHEVRIVPLDGRGPLTPAIRQWIGSSRGHWDGETLVVETTNFSDKTSYRGSSPNMRLVERFTRIDRDTIGFQITVDDPATWARPWTAALPLRPSEGLIYEYACHEANIGLRDILEVARDEEKVEKAEKAAAAAAAAGHQHP